MSRLFVVARAGVRHSCRGRRRLRLPPAFRILRDILRLPDTIRESAAALPLSIPRRLDRDLQPDFWVRTWVRTPIRTRLRSHTLR
jgi:hypothetical protein